MRRIRIAWMTTDLEEVAGAIRSEVQDLAVVLLTNRDGVVDAVLDVGVDDSVPPCGAVDVHVVNIVSRNSARARRDRRRLRREDEHGHACRTR
jgi:hypothetical protein